MESASLRGVLLLKSSHTASMACCIRRSEMPRYTMCPFYVDENKKSISCEDICRTYKTLGEKFRWMDMYCDSWDWMKCPYAADRSEAYEAYEKGDVKALENQEIKALEKENKYLRTLLGKAEKRVERQQKKIDELRAVNQSFTNVNNSLEKQKKEFYTRWRKAQDELDKGNETVMEELRRLGDIYEQRMCYLIDRFADGFFCESDVERWAGDREFALVRQYDEDLGDMVWKVVFKEDEPDKDIQTDVQEGQEVRQPESAD